ncbi:probable two-component response regulator ORR21 at N-terminal half [Coccomyxa sp. Obi]|nr:probable two-component response regulator ORR21 at N-terminal half [Coccomyxa sp. Obi]
MALRRVPSFSCRPGFPNGLQVLVVDGDSKSSQSLQQKLAELSYEVCCCSSGSEASALLRKEAASYDILLVEAKALAKDATDGGSLRESASHLPLVLMSEKSSSTDDVWRGIELGAADVLEKPLSSLKLRNIWQHVVRKMMSSSQESSKEVVPCKSEPKSKAKSVGVSAPSSPRTPSPAASLLTISSVTATEKSGKGSDEASFLGVADVKMCCSTEAPEPSESRATADSPASVQTKVVFPGSSESAGTVGPASKSCSRKRKAKAPDTPASVASRPPLAIRPPAWASPFGLPQQASTHVVGMAPPNCYMQGVDPTNGCVWGTPAANVSQAPAYMPSWGYTPQPLHPGSYVSQSHTADLHKWPSGASSLASSLDSSLTLCGFGPDLPDDDLLLDDVLLPDEDLLDLAPDEPTTMKAPEQPPIGLKLKKSASLVDLINSQLENSSAAAAAVA